MTSVITAGCQSAQLVVAAAAAVIDSFHDRPRGYVFVSLGAFVSGITRKITS